MIKSPVLIASLCVIASLAGCEPGTSPERDPDAPSQISKVPLRVGVYESEAFAARIESGWQGVSDQDVNTTILTDEPIAEIAAKHDVIVMPASRLGEAVASGSVVALPDAFLAGETVRNSTVLTQIRQTQTRLNGETYALSLGAPLAMTLVRDEVAGIPDDRPLTYDEFTAIAETVSDGKPQAAEPLADGDAAISFLRRASSFCGTTWLFDSGDMEPQIDQPPFLRALETLVAARQFYPKELLSAKDIWQRIVDGQLKLAIGLPIDSAEIESDASVRIIPLPQSTEVYSDQWKPREPDAPARVLLPGTGRIVALSSSCRQTSASRGLAAWMTTEGLDAFRRISGVVTVTRVESDADGTDRMRSAAVAQYDRNLRKSLSGKLSHQPMRLPSSSEYLAALDAAVLEALDGHLSPAEALQQAKTQWQAITAGVGVEQQKHVWNAK